MPSHEPMEHAEHAEHAFRDPFDRRVALTIAVVAAVLSSVTVLAHRAHTDTLLLQGQASALSNETFDKWAEYQAKKNRQYADKKTKEIITLMPVRSEDEAKRDKQLRELDDSIAKSETK